MVLNFYSKYFKNKFQEWRPNSLTLRALVRFAKRKQKRNNKAIHIKTLNT